MESKEFFQRIGRAIYHIDGVYEKFAKKSNVKENLLWILYALNDGGSHSQKEICDDWDLPRTTVNTIVKELENDGYVTLEQIAGKSREMKVVLTKNGQVLANNMLNMVYSVEKEVFTQIKSPQKLVSELENLTKILNEKFDTKK